MFSLLCRWYKQGNGNSG